MDTRTASLQRAVEPRRGARPSPTFNFIRHEPYFLMTSAVADRLASAGPFEDVSRSARYLFWKDEEAQVWCAQAVHGRAGVWAVLACSDYGTALDRYQAYEVVTSSRDPRDLFAEMHRSGAFR